MTQRIEAAPGIWYFFSAMSTQVWIILVVTAIGTGLIVWMYEIGMQALSHNTRSLSNVMWDTIGRPVEMRDYRLSSNAANVLAFAWSFLVFILFALYTANLTANLTVTQLQTDIKGVSDLPGLTVGSPTFVSELILPKYNVKAVPFNQAGEADDIAMIDALTNGTIKALVSDAAVLRSKDAQNCGTVIVGAEFDISDSGPLFPAGTPREIIEAYDLALLQLQLGGVFQEMNGRFVNPKPASCKVSDVQTETSSVTWQEAAGLWVILGVGAAIGLLLVGNHWFMKWAVPRLRKHAWFYRCCPCANPRSTLTRSYTAAVSIGGFTRTPRVPASGDKEETMDALWDDRYAGASEGYLDGSADMMQRDPGLADAHSGPNGGVAAAVRSGAREMKQFNDSANRREGGVVDTGNKNNNGALRLVLNELSNMRAQLASLQNSSAHPPQHTLEPMDSHRVRFAEDV
jgi:hypothetical protein